MTKRDSALLWTPASARQERRTHVCRICSVRLAESEVEGHSNQCWRANEAELRQMSPRAQHPLIFGDHDVDTEFIKWHRTNPKGETYGT